MFHGGTNFGFMAGANQGLGATNEGNKNPYQADVTSYGKCLADVTSYGKNQASMSRQVLVDR